MYYIRHKNSHFNQFYNNRDISYILYINNQFKCCFVTKTIESHLKQSNSEGYKYLQQWLADKLIIID